MPKIKTHSGAKKRFKKTANGFKFKRANKRHLALAKTQKQQRQKRAKSQLNKADVSMVERLLNVFVKKRRG